MTKDLARPAGAELRPYAVKGIRIVDRFGETAVMISPKAMESDKLAERIVLLLNGGSIPMHSGGVLKPGESPKIFSGTYWL